MTDHKKSPPTPRWVKILFTVAIVLILLFVVLKLTGIGGEHGPGRHLSENDSLNYTSPVERQLIKS